MKKDLFKQWKKYLKKVAVFYYEYEANLALEALNRRHYLKEITRISEDAGAYEAPKNPKPQT